MPEPSEVRPKLRALRTQTLRREGRSSLLLEDPLGLSQTSLVLPGELAPLLALMDGTRTEGALRAALEVRAGIRLPPGRMVEVLQQLDDALFLENDRFRQASLQTLEDYRRAPHRAPALAGKSYPAEPEKLKEALGGYLAKVPPAPVVAGPLRGLVSPHIDYARGGAIYAQTWSAAREALKEVELAIILGTDHQGGEGTLTLTRQSYTTPLGILPTAQDAVDRLAQVLGEDRAFAEELHHQGEHSVELSAVWLHYFLGKRPCQLLPILCGSFQPFLEKRQSPLEDDFLAKAVEALREVASSRPCLVVASADLAHVGPAFGDPRPLDRLSWAEHARRDRGLLSAMASADAERFFQLVAAEGDRRRICGLGPIYLALKILEGAKGEVISYAQCPADEREGSFVSIAGAIFHPA